MNKNLKYMKSKTQLLKNILVAGMLGILTLGTSCGNGKAAPGKDASGEKKALAKDSVSVGAPIHLTRAQFLARVVNYIDDPNGLKYLGDKPCIVDFYADWCGPCRMAAPVMEELAREYAGKIYIYKVDTQKEQQLAAEIGIQGIPAFLFCPVNGQIFGSSGIARTREETKAMFKKIIEEQLLKTGASSKM